MKGLRFALGSIAVAALLARPSVAYEHPSVAKGLENPTAYELGDLDSINVHNGSLSMTIPLGITYPVSPQLSYRFTMVWLHRPFDTTLLTPGQPGNPQVDHDRRANAGFGWRLSFGELISPQSLRSDGGWQFIGQDGSQHTFFRQMWTDGGSCREATGSASGVCYTSDGSFYRLTFGRACPEFAGPCHIVETPDGLQYQFETFEQQGDGSHRLRRIEDQFGNSVDLGYSIDIDTEDFVQVETITVSDSHDRSHTMKFADPYTDMQKLIDLKLDAFGDTTADFGFTHSEQYIDKPNGGMQACIKYPTLDVIELPADAGLFTFGYQTSGNDLAACEASGNSGAGELARVDLPTGGHMRYQYAEFDVGGFPASSPGDPCDAGVEDCDGGGPGQGGNYDLSLLQRVTGVSQKSTYRDDTTLDGVWTYAHERVRTTSTPNTGDLNPIHRVTVRSPEGDDTVYFFDNRMGSRQALPIRTDCRRWNNPDPNHPWQDDLPWGTSECDWDTPETLTTGDRFHNTILLSDGDFAYLSRLEYEGDAPDSSGEVISNPFTANLKRSIWLRYESGELNTQLPGGSPPIARALRIAAESTIYHETGTGTHQTETFFSEYDGLGHYQRTDEKADFFSNDDRTTYADFNDSSSWTCSWPWWDPLDPWDPTDPNDEPSQAGKPSCSGNITVNGFSLSTVGLGDWLLNLADSRSVEQDGMMFKEDFCYDGVGYVDGDQHKGFLTSHRKLSNTTPQVASNWTRRPWDVVREMTPNGQGFVEFERSYGGDNDTVSTARCGGESGPEYEYQNQYQYGSLHQRNITNGPTGTNLNSIPLVDNTIDRWTGLVASSRDTGGVQTVYDYDVLGRVTEAQTEADACTVLTYTKQAGTTPASVRTQQRPLCTSAATAALTEQTIEFDGLGRLDEESQLIPNVAGGTSSDFTARRLTSYTGSGWKKSVSTLGTATSNKTQFLNFDRYGRAGLMRAPDGKEVTVTRSGVQTVNRTFSATTVTGTDATFAPGSFDSGDFVQKDSDFGKTESYDRFGRLQSVSEDVGIHDASGNTAQRTRATYAYTPHGEIKGVNMLVFDRGTSATCQPNVNCQQRTFTYDGRGFLAAESQPEFDGVTRTYQYDSQGNRTRSYDGRTTLDYVYDELGNLENVKNGSTVLKEYDYYYGSAVESKRGRLRRATRFNSLQGLQQARTLPENGRAIASEEFTYDDLGRVASKLTEIEIEDDQGVGGQGWQFLQRYSYDNLGNLDKLSYPCIPTLGLDDCNGGSVEGGGEPGTAPAHRRQIDYDYRRSYLVGVHDAFGAESYIPQIRYHPNGMFAQATLNTSYDATIDSWSTVTYQHGMPLNQMQRPASIGVNGPGGPITYDGSGNVAAAGDELYFYDGSGRLNAVLTGGKGDPQNPDPFAEVYEYDGFGNRTAVYRGDPDGGVPGGLDIQTPDSVQPAIDWKLNRIDTTLETRYAFDASGNVTSRPGSSTQNISSVFDAFNLKMVERQHTRLWKYFYTADDQRVGMIRPAADPDNEATLYIRDLGGQLLTEFDLRPGFIFADGFESGNTSAWSSSCAGAGCDDGGGRGGASVLTRLDAGWQRDYIYRGSQHQVTVALGDDGDEDGRVRRSMIHDHLGTPRITYKSEGGSEGYYLLPFGRRLPSAGLEQGQREQALRYTSHERDLGDENDATDDLDYMKARHCSPVLGRFMGIDPINSAKPVAPQTWNKYAYVRNSPVNYFDPDGRKDETTVADRRILEDPDVLLAVADMLDLTGLDNPMHERQEVGALIANDRNGDGVYVSGGLRTDGNPGGVKISYPSSTDVAAFMHTHPGEGFFIKQGTRVRAFGGDSSPRDRQEVEKTGKPMYILNAEQSVLRVTKGSDGKADTETILSEEHMATYLEKARSVQKAQVENRE